MFDSIFCRSLSCIDPEASAPDPAVVDCLVDCPVGVLAVGCEGKAAAVTGRGSSTVAVDALNGLWHM